VEHRLADGAEHHFPNAMRAAGSHDKHLGVVRGRHQRGPAPLRWPLADGLPPRDGPSSTGRSPGGSPPAFGMPRRDFQRCPRGRTRPAREHHGAAPPRRRTRQRPPRPRILDAHHNGTREVPGGRPPMPAHHNHASVRVVGHLRAGRPQQRPGDAAIAPGAHHHYLGAGAVLAKYLSGWSTGQQRLHLTGPITLRADRSPWARIRSPHRRARSEAATSVADAGYPAAHAWQTVSKARRERASRAAHVSASSLPADPSYPARIP
jgi:hypothetical protein